MMLTIQVISTIEKYVETLQETEYAIGQIAALSKLYDEVANKVADLTINLDDASTVTRRCREFSKEVSNAVGTVSASISMPELFTSLRNSISRFEHLAPELHVESLQVIQHLRDAEWHFNEYFHDKNAPDRAVRLVIQSHRTHAAVSTFRETLRVIANNLANNGSPEPPQGRLVLVFDVQASIETVTSRLTAIDDAYRHICELIGVDPSAHQLLVTRIESGSIWTDLLGWPVAVRLLDDFLRAAAKFLYRRYSREGQLETAGDVAGRLFELINIRNKLSEAGIDTAFQDRQLEDFAVLQTAKLMKIVHDTGLVSINDEWVVEHAVRQPRLTNSVVPPETRNLEAK